MSFIKNVYAVLFKLILILQTNGERTKDKMYEKINGTSACFRRLNSTHEIGCSSARSGTTGVIHIIDNESDLDFLLKSGTAGPYMAVMPYNMLKPEIMHKISGNSNKISGLLVHKNITSPHYYTHEAKCPNEQYALEGFCDPTRGWNPHGTGILQKNFKFPIFLISDLANLKEIRNCFSKFNDFDYENQGLRSLCSLEMDSFMFGAVNSQTCLRRSNWGLTFSNLNYCDALGDHSIWYTLRPFGFAKESRDVILLSARMDTTSLFTEEYPGAESTVTGMVTLLTTANLLKKMISGVTSYRRNVLFVLFNGESYDYMASQRFVYDILNKKFPLEKDNSIKNQPPYLTLDDIKLIVELGQFGLTSKLYSHYLNADSEVTNFLKTFTEYAYKFNLSVLNSQLNTVPPASLHSFLRERSNMSGFVLTNHNQSFTNPYYNSFCDDSKHLRYRYYNTSENIEPDSLQWYVANTSTVLARSLYEQFTGGVVYSGSEVADINIINELFNCYLDTANCLIYKAVLKTEDIDDKPLSLYVGVVPHNNIVTTLTGRVLAWLTGDIDHARNQTDCNGDPQDPIYQLLWMSKDLNNINATKCYNTTMNYTSSVSPAFVIKDYNWDSGEYSTWTESVWKDFTVRMFLKPSSRHEFMNICVGIVTLVLSVALVYFVNIRSDILFPKPVATGQGTSC